MTEETNLLLDELLEDTSSTSETSDFNLTTLFNSQEEADKFFDELPMYIMNLWARNDKIIHVLTPVGASSTMRKVIESCEIPGMQGELVELFKSLKESIQYTEVPDETGVKMVTLKQAINANELLSAHGWSNDPQINLYDTLRTRNLIIQPTMEELRMLLLLDTLLEIRENNKKIVTASRVPPLIR